jgi:hypothetical protein
VEDPPQFVRITSPQIGEILPPGTPALLTAEAFDVETNLARIQFYQQSPAGPLLGVSTNAPYSATWSNPPSGDFVLYAVAYDQTGLSATSPPVSVSFSLPVLTPARLSIAAMTNAVLVGWPDWVGSNALQSTTTLTAPVHWSEVTNSPVLGAGAWMYFVSPTNSSFFRLAY